MLLSYCFDLKKWIYYQTLLYGLLGQTVVLIPYFMDSSARSTLKCLTVCYLLGCVGRDHRNIYQCRLSSNANNRNKFRQLSSHCNLTQWFYRKSLLKILRMTERMFVANHFQKRVNLNFLLFQSDKQRRKIFMRSKYASTIFLFYLKNNGVWLDGVDCY